MKQRNLFIKQFNLFLNGDSVMQTILKQSGDCLLYTQKF